MNILTARNLDVSNAFQNTNSPINEIVCVSPPLYYLEWFEKYYPNVPLNQDEGSYFFQCMNVIQETKPAGRQWNRLLDAVAKILKYKKGKIDHVIYIKVFSDVIVYYIMVSTDDVLNNTNNKTVFPELRRVFQEYFEIKVQE